MNASKREAMQALYAFCRVVDDVADGPQPVAEKRQQLADWKEEVTQISAGNPTHAIAMALQQTRLWSADHHPYFIGIIEGVAMDVDGRMVQPTMDELMRYCYGVAGCVGMLTLAIMDVDRKKFAGFAEALGRALQLTNMLRDVAVDAAMGRIYLPKEWLQEAGLATITPEQIVQDEVDLSEVRAKLSETAKRHYDYVHHYPMTRRERWKLLPALLMCDVYERKHKRLQKNARSMRKDKGITLKDKLILLLQLMGHLFKCLLPGGSAQSHKADSPLPVHLRP